MSERPEAYSGPPCPCHTNTGGRCGGVITNGVCTRCRRKFSEDEVLWLEYAARAATTSTEVGL